MKWKVDGSWAHREEQSVKFINEHSVTLNIFQVLKISNKDEEVTFYIFSPLIETKGIILIWAFTLIKYFPGIRFYSVILNYNNNRAAAQHLE